MFSSLYRKPDVRIADDEISKYVKVRYSQRARKMSLKLDPHSATVILTIPNKGNPIRAIEFVQAHKSWILDKVSALPEPVAFTEGATVPLLGCEHTIKIIKHNKKRTIIDLEDGVVLVQTNLNDPASRIKRWLKEYAREQLSVLAYEKTKILGSGHDIQSVSIRDTKSRWGSCSDDGKLSFSWRLIFAPISAFDYVVAHEVAHLVHMNHSKKFWSLCESLSSNYSEGRDWMDKHGNSLMRFGQSN